MEITDLPFNQHIGIEKSDAGVALRKKPELLNHVGTIHAAALYGLAETASGDWIIEQLMTKFPDTLALARQGSIQYKRPAESDCTAEANVDSESLASCIAELENRGRATLTVPVRILCNGKPVATAEFEWWFSHREKS